MIEEFFENIKMWAKEDENIESVILVGSYARNKIEEDSDVDLCIITKNKEEMVNNIEYINKFGSVLKYQKEYYGVVTSIRVWYDDQKEVEFSIADSSWISIPLDSGTHKVLSDGYKVILNKKDYFSNLII